MSWTRGIIFIIALSVFAAAESFAITVCSSGADYTSGSEALRALEPGEELLFCTGEVHDVRGFYRLGDPLHRPSTWLPLLMIGAHPKLMALPKRVRRLSSHVDLAPTVLDLIGARDPNSFAGHSLLDPTFRADPYVFASHGLELVWEQGHHRSLLPPPGLTRPQGEEIFNNVEDFLMDHPLEGPEIAPLLDEARRYTLALRRLTDHVFFTDTLIPQAGRAPAAP